MQTSALFTTLCKKYHCSILLDNRAQRIVTLLRNGTREQSPHGQEPKRMSGDLDWHLFPKCQREKYFYCDSISPLLKGNDKNTSPQNEERLLVILPRFQAIGKAWRLVCSLAQARGGPKDSPGRSFPWLWGPVHVHAQPPLERKQIQKPKLFEPQRNLRAQPWAQPAEGTIGTVPQHLGHSWHRGALLLQRSLPKVGRSSYR